jgi:hypothetical protein
MSEIGTALLGQPACPQFDGPLVSYALGVGSRHLFIGSELQQNVPFHRLECSIHGLLADLYRATAVGANRSLSFVINCQSLLLLDTWRVCSSTCLCLVTVYGTALAIQPTVL